MLGSFTVSVLRNIMEAIEERRKKTNYENLRKKRKMEKEKWPVKAVIKVG